MRELNSLKILLLSLLLIGIGINIGQFPVIDDKQSNNYKALNISESSNAIEVGTNQSPTLRGYYLPWYTLSIIAPESNIIVPKSSQGDDGFSRFDNSTVLSRLRGFGDTNSVTIKEIEPIGLDSVIESNGACVVASGENTRQDLPYFAIVMDLGSCPERRTTSQNGLYISEKLPVKNEVTFLLVPWEGPEEPFHPSGNITELSERKADFYALLIEVSLLSESTREDIGL